MARALLTKQVEAQLPKDVPVEPHFSPRYDPWDQRLCLVPDGDLFKAMKRGTASVVTDTIDTFTASGIRLASGAELEADIVVTATGLTLVPAGGITFEVDGERYLLPGLRVQVRARYYTQTGALFYSDDYTGGEPVDGPRGQYWTGDRELSPLNSVLLGGRFVYSKRATPEQRILGAFLGISGNVGLDLMKTHLKSFTWGGVTPATPSASASAVPSRPSAAWLPPLRSTATSSGPFAPSPKPSASMS